MAEGMRWRKAVVISLLLHGIVLTGVGWMAVKTFAVHDIPEQYLELDLANEPDGSSRSADNADSGSAAANDGQAVTAAMSAPTANAPVVSGEPAPSVQAFASSMSVLSAETSSNVSGPEVDSGQGEGGTMSGGAGTNNGMGKGTGTGTGTGTGSGTGTGNGRSGKGGGIISPGILSQVEPVYPEQAKQAGREGTVVLKIQILENGRPGYVSVYRSSGYDGLDDAAVDAVRQWRFIPAKERESGQAVVCNTTMPVVFRLKS